MIKLNFSESVNFEQQKFQYQKDRKTRIFNVFDKPNADKLFNFVSNLEFVYSYTDGNLGKTISQHEILQMSTEEKRSFFADIHSRAAKGIGFFYGKFPIKNKHNIFPILDEIYSWINSNEMLIKIRLITGIDSIKNASAQITKYQSGHFLTRHNDINHVERRRVAYVLNLSPFWHPDWGGLLQFYEQTGTPNDIWVPIFNSLNLFDVQLIHSVTYVTPFCQTPRYAITGWFNSE